MRPNQLIMSAFGPFGKTQKISFDALCEHGLFLITGDTGAGKTTIFDAISFALYGEASGDNRTCDSLRSHYAKPEADTYVTLLFTHKEKQYSVTRNPNYERAKRRGEGMTRQTADATLTLPDQTVVTGYTQVTAKINEILGIDYKQFKQIAMIAQGEFLKLLLAGSDDRSQIFRKVFSTDFYNDFTQKLKSKSLLAYGAVADLDKSILLSLEGINTDTEWEHYEYYRGFKQNPDIYQAPALLLLILEYNNKTKANYDTLEESLNELSETIRTLEKKITIQKQKNEKINTGNRLNAEVSVLLSKKEEMEEKRKVLNDQKLSFYTVSPAYEHFVRVNKEVGSYSASYEKKLKTKELLIEKRELLVKEQEQSKEEKPLLEKNKLRADKLTSEISLQQQKKALNAQLLKAKAEEDSYKKHRTDLVLQREALKKETEQLNLLQKQSAQIEDQLTASVTSVEQAKTLYRQVKKLSDLTNQVKEAQAETKKQQALYLEAEKAYREQNATVLAKETEFYREQAGILASHLKEQEPCPVCGSLTHPSLAKLNNTAPTQEELKKLKQTEEEKRKALEKISISHQSSATKQREIYNQLSAEFLVLLDMEAVGSLVPSLAAITIKELSQALIEAGLEEVTEAGKRLSKEKNQLLLKKKERSKREELLSELLQKDQNAQTEIAALEEKGHALMSTVQRLSGSIVQISESLVTQDEADAKNQLMLVKKLILELSEKIRQREESFTACENELAAVTASLSQLSSLITAKKEEQEKAKAAYQNKLSETGLLTEEKFKANLVSEAKITAAEKEIIAYEKELSEKQTLLHAILEETKGEKIVDCSVLEQKQSELSREKKQKEVLKEQLYLRLHTNQKIFEDVTKRQEASEKARKEYEMISELSKTASGDLSQKAKIRFEQYVQAFYLDQVVAEANKRLDVMSFHQYELRRSFVAENLRSSSALDLVVLDHYTGKERSVKSLSGGESFKAALSLALGLSDVIQSYAGGIELDSMFIDEGFGSLDTESLDKAITTLNTLATGNRMVGIISHVNELKERIDKKIVLKKTMEGSEIQGV